MTAPAATRTTAEWQELDRRHHLHPFTDYKALAKEGSRIITRAAGVYLWDSEGNRILDGMAGLWNVNVGYGRKEIAEAAYQQMLELPYYNTFFKTATPPPIALSKTLIELTPPGLNRVFFASSGSEANDTIVRMVRHYWNLVGKPNKKTFISLKYAYHGSTMVAASLGGISEMHAQADLPLPGFVHIMPPYWYALGGDMSPEEFGRHAARALEEKIAELGPDNVAAFIGEPIQGAGGLIVPPDTYWPEVQRICRAHDVLLIADEVICGFGRTGKWFGSDTYRIEPDLMPLAKGLTSGYLPLSALMVGDRVTEVLIEKGEEFFHGFTNSGHPVACAVALENIRIIEHEKLVETVGGDTGPYFQSRLGELADHPLVGEVRGVGFIAGIELVEDKPARRRFDPAGKVGSICRDLCLKHGLVARAVGDVMVLSPPLIMTRDEIDKLVSIIGKCLDLTARELNR